jgi:hypothetical protein
MPDLGLSVARIRFKDGKQRHVIVRLEPVNEGAMYEYHDPVTDEVVGCVGRNRLAEFTTPLAAWTDRSLRGLSVGRTGGQHDE